MSGGDLGARLRQERMTKGRSISDLAAALHYTRAHLSAVEKGTGRPSRALIEGYERELQLPAGTLIRLMEQQPSNGSNSEFMTGILEGLSEDFVYPPKRIVARTTQESVTAAASTDETGDVEVIHGRDAVLNRAMALIEMAISRLPPAQEPILITYHVPVGGARRQVLREALEAGWRVEVAYRLHQREREERLQLAQGILSLVPAGTSRFGAYALDPVMNATEAIVVPGCGAMLFLTTQGRESETACFFDPSTHARFVATLTAHLGYLTRGGQPLLKVYAYEQIADSKKPDPLPLNRLRFNYALTRSLQGDTYLMQDGLSIMRLMPLAIETARAYRILASKGREWLDLSDAYLEQRARQIAIFHEQLATGVKCFDLIGKPGIEELVRAGDIRGDWLGQPLTLEERLVYLSSAVDALQHENYQIGLIEEALPVTYLVTGVASGGVVIFEKVQSEGLTTQAYAIEMREPALASEARKHFWHAWEQPTVLRDKDEVLSYLHSKIQELETRIAAGEGNSPEGDATRATTEPA